jgi:DNA-binding NtrC family response regulator
VTGRQTASKSVSHASFNDPLQLMDRESVQERFGIIGTSAAIRQVIDRIRQVARTDITVLIEGESGVGKELVAHAIHEMSMRRHKSHLVVNCGAIPEGLLESELFGAEKGAYTGAVERRSGYFEEADGGTLFLDEIGEMPQAAQVRLLRVLETGQFSRVGSSTVLRSDVRIIAATNKNLGTEVEAGRFREDLYYRLSTVIIRIPPLRERKEDILPIFRMFLHRFTQKYNSPPRQLDHSAIDFLTNYRWPGNVRELRNVAEQVVVLQRGDTVTADDIRPYTRGVTAGGTSSDLLPVAVGSSGDVGEARERELIYRALLELRIEVREMREELKRLAGQAVPVARPSLGDRSEAGGPFVVVRRSDFGAEVIEDVIYEIESEDVKNGEPTGRPEPERPPSVLDLSDSRPLPTIENVEQQLIQTALKRFEGNRRQTARALGISERTLYRKIKEIEE